MFALSVEGFIFAGNSFLPPIIEQKDAKYEND